MQGKKQTKVPAAKKGGISVSNRVELNPHQPIPFEGARAFSTIQKEKYSPFLSGTDDFGQLLLEAKLLSVTHEACIDTKKIYCAGQGLYDRNTTDPLPTYIQDFLKQLNGRNESENAIQRKIFGSLFTFGNVPIEIKRLEYKGKRRIFVHVHNMLDWRLGWPDLNGDITYAVQSRLFRRRNEMLSLTELREANEMPLYNQFRSDKKNWKDNGNGTQSTMIWLKYDTEGFDDYGMPPGHTSLTYQLLEYKYARYNLDNLDNNMVVSALLALKGNVSDAECTRIAKKIIDTHSGDGKRGRVVVFGSEEGMIDGSSLHTLDTQKEGSYKEADDQVMKKILLSHRWSAMLAGLADGEGMGKGNSFLRTEYKLRKKTTIDPAQEIVMSGFWFTLFEICEQWLGGDWSFDIWIRDIDPVSALAEMDGSAVVKVNEMREELGFPKDDSPKGELYIAELKAAAKPEAEPKKEDKDVPTK